MGRMELKMAWERCHEKYMELRETVPAVLCNQRVVMILEILMSDFEIIKENWNDPAFVDYYYSRPEFTHFKNILSL
jgi:hypothetical protein